MFKTNLALVGDLVDQEKKVVCVIWQIALKHQTKYVYYPKNEMRLEILCTFAFQNHLLNLMQKIGVVTCCIENFSI